MSDEVSSARLPQGSCDGHFHVFGDPERYPARRANPHYSTPSESIEDARRVHADVGYERGAIVQASIYMTDHSLLKDVLADLPRDRYRGVAIIDDSVTDAELASLHAAGVRASRFMFVQALGISQNLSEFHRSIARISELGWFAKVFAFGDDLLELDAELASVTVPLVLDHMGRLDFSLGTTQPACDLIVDRLKNQNWWIMLSNGDRSSAGGAPWDDAAAFGRLFYEAAPDRCIWGSDWPHVHYGGPPPSETDLIQLLRRYVPDDEALRRVLVDNPARLFGFSA